MADEKFHTGMMRKSLVVRASRQKAWAKLSRIADLPWVAGVRDAAHLPGPKSGPGAARLIRFQDGGSVTEYITGWRKNEYLSYIATGGLPLRAYHATISIKADSGRTRVTWESYFESQKMTASEFAAFVSFIGCFYADSLGVLKSALEDAATKT